MADVQTRPDRSNSLQRMLELEKRAMMERLQPPAMPSAIPFPSATSSRTVSPPRPTIATRRAFALVPKGAAKAKAAEAPKAVPQLPPLAIHIPVRKPISQEDEGRGRKPTRSNIAQNAPVATPERERPVSKVVSFEIPGVENDRRSICDSPSWEAYESRKIVKKEEKRAKEQSVKDQAAKDMDAKDKKRRLSKFPPPSSPHALQMAHKHGSETALNFGLQKLDKVRSGSSVDLTSPQKTDPPVRQSPVRQSPVRQSRRRSGSFSSLFRSPFESRRSSIDPGSESDTGFIGGIKLEIEKHVAHQKALDAQAQSDESDIHPALRSSRSNQRGMASLKSPPPPSRDNGADAQRRAYPPITRRGHAKTVSLVSPTAPAIPDLGKIEKWRSRVGLKSALKQSQPENENARVSSDIDTATTHESRPKLKDTKKENAVEVITVSYPEPQSAVLQANSPTLSLTDKMEAQNATATPTEQSETSPAPGRNALNLQVVVQSPNGHRAGPSTPPPEPPRRSSKRNSLLNLSGTLPFLPARSIEYSSDASQFDSDYLNTHSDAYTSSLPSSIQCSPKVLPVLQMSTSDDSSSERFHSPSFPGTPDTSRPQSSRGLPPLLGDTRRFNLDQSPSEQMNEYPFKAAPQASFKVHDDCDSPYPSDENFDDAGSDPIQEAAEKVLAVYSQIPIGRPSIKGRRPESDSIITSTMPLRLREKPSRREALSESNSPREDLMPKELHVSINPRTQSVSSPATYLKDARRGNTQSQQQSYSATSKAEHPAAKYGARAGDTIAKFFVECCSCHYYHDMPSNLYAAMSNPEGMLSPRDKIEFSGAICMTVQCPWCKHDMSTRCCAGLAATVQVKERFH